MLLSIDAASQEAVVGSAQPAVVVARARTPRDAAVQHCLEYLGSKHPAFELEGSARSVVQHQWIKPTNEGIRSTRLQKSKINFDVHIETIFIVRGLGNRWIIFRLQSHNFARKADARRAP